MVDYSKLSDAEIAQKVFFWVSDKICPKGGLAHFFNGAFFYSEGKSSAKTFDPCNNPADAWPIIIENKISIVPLDKEWIAIPVDKAIDGITGDYDVCFYAQEDVADTNPLRAAMIVFLMMQDSNNG